MKFINDFAVLVNEWTVVGTGDSDESKALSVHRVVSPDRDFDQ